MSRAKWPGPFKLRPENPRYLRPCVWVNCYHCGLLFPKEATFVSRRRTKDGTHLFCSPSHQALSQDRRRGVGSRVTLIPRHCIVCGKEFLPPKNSSPIQHCGRKCGTFTQSQKAARWQNRIMEIYLASRGITRSEYACEYCTRRTHVSITHKNGDWTDLRPGNLEARCINCAYLKKTGKPLAKQEAVKW